MDSQTRMKIAVGWFTWRKLAVMAALIALLAAIVAVAVFGCAMELTTTGVGVDCRQAHNRTGGPAPQPLHRVKRRPAPWSGPEPLRRAPVPSDAMT